jgi:CheY-like chemotaxis protein
MALYSPVMMGILQALSSLVSGRETDDVDAQKGKAAAKRPTEQCTILVIDDDSQYLQIVRTALREAGYNVLASTSGPKGLDMLRYAPSAVRVVLLDYDMPKLNGAETLTYLRRLNPHAKIIAVTGMDPNFLPAEFREGVEHTIYKPFRMEELISLIERMAEAYPVLQPASTA